MDIIKGSECSLSGTAVAFGRFDGVHLGHRALLRSLSAVKGLRRVVLSLDFQPSGLFGSGGVLSTEEEKASLIEGFALDTMVSMTVDRAVAEMSAEDFVREVLVRRLGAKRVFVGASCRFGRGRQGTVALLRSLGASCGFEVVECAEARVDGKPVDSAWIRDELQSGSLEKANELLGAPYSIYGEVVHGKALGRTVGMPTANLQAHPDKIIPKHGVYGTISVIDGQPVRGLTNIGRRPSVDNNTYVTVEAFLLDFSKDIYGRRFMLELHAYIRGVVKFNSLDEVKRQVEKDIDSIRVKLDALCVR